MDTILASENSKTIEENTKHRGPLTSFWAGKLVLFSETISCESTWIRILNEHHCTTFAPTLFLNSSTVGFFLVCFFQSLCPFSHFEIFICVFIPRCEILQSEYACRSGSIVWPFTDSQHETLTQPDHQQHLNRCEHMWRIRGWLTKSSVERAEWQVQAWP